MLLESKQIPIKWIYNTKNYYINKGYIFTNFGDVFYINPTHLKKSSDVFVHVQCDYCGKEYTIQYKKYISRVVENKNGIHKCACEDCRHIKLKERNDTYGYWGKSKEAKDFYRKLKTIYTIDFVREEFEKVGYILLTNEYINTSQKLEYICPRHGLKHTTFNHFYNNGKRCGECFHDGRRGNGNNNWNGGITSLNHYLRGNLDEWKNKSLEHYDYTCFISREKGVELEIHHRKPFHLIVEEVLKELNFDNGKYQICDFKDNELEDILDLFLKKSYEELGYPLKKSIHRDFHNIYGMKTNEEDFDEYVESKKL